MWAGSDLDLREAGGGGVKPHTCLSWLLDKKRKKFCAKTGFVQFYLPCIAALRVVDFNTDLDHQDFIFFSCFICLMSNMDVHVHCPYVLL